MKKFLGEMTFEEFKDALKIILAKDESEGEERKWYSFIVDFKDSILDFFKALINFEYSFFNFFKSIKTLTKEEFVEKGKKFKAGFMELIDTVVFVIIAVIIIRYFIGEIRWIPSGSMKPTLIEGDRVFVERMSRFSKSPKRGDIMVFYPPSTVLSNNPIALFKRLTGFFCDDIAFIKRVIGEPGDKFEIVNNSDGSFTVLINDVPLEETYIKDSKEYPVCDGTILCGPMVLGKDEYFMMGDNRGHSSDSRYWGVLKKDRFIGRAVLLMRLGKI